ncbi:unnamed protein product [Effrenium voratum]|uniref:Uncharacterized protein n=1 Tax=Effrenium voratum TaxID=2562239 RepID=A0AA36IHX6_9DINO|nr:unnamed protein product [Effrenium voratum]|mmetsp:Transcript_61262/g.146010  ORF Transcript_61262/g.146010 Transcript_61262/m.146010 type:complete len:181 (-) Transcript_61262:114-656(-)
MWILLLLNLVVSEADKSCPYYQASGCILDQMEKVCEGEANEMITPSAEENIWMCCCPNPYVPCSSNESDETCVKAIRKQLKDHGSLGLDGLLEVRKTLLGSSEQCGGFFLDTVTPICKEWPSAMPKLMCEMLTWQWEELGDGNSEEFAQFSCPMIEANRASDGNSRKGHALSWDPQRREL